MMNLYMTPHQRAHMRRRMMQGDRVARNVAAANCDIHIPVDVREDAEAYEIIATLPGLSADDINIEIQENIVGIHGEFKTEEDTEGYLRRERPAGTFQRHLRFPANLVSDETDAALKDGILTLRIPKVEEQRPITIKVNKK
ncbi:MAG: Hsp20/alpha crystallin family protein [Anaerolineales bacterium]|nr:Hsp20/alpha crystallin family protein [Anaerolineales bacterium]